MRSKTSFALLFTITLLAGAARAEDDDPAKGHFTLEQATKGLAGDGPLTAKIETTLGTFTCELYDKQAPITVANFVGLARGTRPWKNPKTGKWVENKPLYDGLIFHRVIPGFMIQGGDPLGTGTGKPGYSFQDELSPELKFDKPGLLAMANAGPGTNGSQFFITEGKPRHLNGLHTIFGLCEPLALVSKITGVNHVVMKKVTIARGKQEKGTSGDPPRTIADADRPSVVNPGYAKDLERAKAAHVDTSVFGVPFGEPVKLPRCRNDYRDKDNETCLRYKESGAPAGFYIPHDAPNWLEYSFVSIELQQGILTAVRMDTIGTNLIATDLVKKFGKGRSQVRMFSNAYGKTVEAVEMEWRLPGLIVKYGPWKVEWDGTIKGTLTIELETVARAREAQKQEREAKKVKL